MRRASGRAYAHRVRSSWPVMVLLVAAGCVDPGVVDALCGPSTCTGCCTSSGRCEPGDQAAACGAGGERCLACSAPTACTEGLCRAPAGPGRCEQVALVTGGTSTLRLTLCAAYRSFPLDAAALQVGVLNGGVFGLDVSADLALRVTSTEAAFTLEAQSCGGSALSAEPEAGSLLFRTVEPGRRPCRPSGSEPGPEPLRRSMVEDSQASSSNWRRPRAGRCPGGAPTAATPPAPRPRGP